jgi:amino acid transporter
MLRLFLDSSKRLLVGRPLRTTQLRETLLPKRLALPVFGSDPLSTNAYAPEQILLGLAVGGLALTHLAPWVAAAVVILLVFVIASYRQICRVYPQGGGAYSVTRDNLGRRASLVAGSALIVDYVLTVAVSVSAGVANVVSAVPALTAYAVPLSVGLVAVLTVVNLRGLRQSGMVFAVPAYGFIAVVLLMVLWGAARVGLGNPPVAESASFGIEQTGEVTGLFAVAVILRAFAQGSTALAGMEVVSNGVPHFRKPQSRNAAATLALMGTITITMLVGLTALAVVADVRVAEEVSQLTGAPAGYEQKTVIAQLADATFGKDSLLFFLVAAFTAAILLLAANTAFNGFPVLASVLGRDGFFPRQFARRGDRLVFSNGILVLGTLAALLIWLFDASTSRLIQLYIIGVFVSFTLSQVGMVRYWTRARHRTPDPVARSRYARSRIVNVVGAFLTVTVLLVIVVSKFAQGGWIILLALPVLYLMMGAIKRHYERTEAATQPGSQVVMLPSRVHAIVLVSKLHMPTLRALAYARATRPSTLTAVTVQTSPQETKALLEEWDARGVNIPLTVLDSPYRDITTPVLAYVSRARRKSPRDLISIFVPEYVVDSWWKHLLHNQSALRLRARLMFRPGVVITTVPWQLGTEGRAHAEEVEREREATEIDLSEMGPPS